MPLLLAFFTALALEPLVRLVKKGLKTEGRVAPVTAVFVIYIGVIGTIGYFAVTKVVNEAIRFLTRMPYYSAAAIYYTEEALENLYIAVADWPEPVIKGIMEQIDYYLDIQHVQSITHGIIDQIPGWAQALPNIILLTIIYMIALYMMSLDLPRLKERFYKLFTEENEEKVRFMANRLGKVFVGFFKAQFLVSIVIFIVSYIGLLLISPSNALLMAFIIWIIDFIPIIGSIVILAPWAIFSFIVADTVMGVKLIILAAVLLTLRRSLEPMIMGDQIGLSALSTLIAIYLGLYFFGIVGLIAGPLVLIAIKSAKEAGLIKWEFKI